VTYQPHIVYATTGLPSQDMGGVAFSSNNLMASPRVRATLLARYSPVENFTVDVMEKWRSKLRQVAEPSIVSSSDIPTVAYTNLNLDYRMERGGGEAQVFLNIQNLFDRDPPPGAFYGANTAPGLYGGYVNGDDVIGRYYTLGLRYRL
jgi:outer membrane receptor protein involved in Fe transport